MATNKVTTSLIDMSGDTGGLVWAKGTTAQRPTGVAGDLRLNTCLLYTSPSPRDRQKSRMPSSA